MWLGFKSWSWCHKWVEFVVDSHPSRDFSLGSPVYLPSYNNNVSELQQATFDMFRRAGRELHQVEAGWSLGGTLAPASSQPHPFLFGHFSIFCFGNGTDLCSLYLYHLQVWKRWNLHSKRRGKWVKASLMLVNRTRCRKKFLELAIWEVFYRRKSG